MPVVNWNKQLTKIYQRWESIHVIVQPVMMLKVVLVTFAVDINNNINDLVVTKDINGRLPFMSQFYFV
jgi:hypothetical protein